MFQRVEAMLVAAGSGSAHQRGHPHRHGKHHARPGEMGIAQQMQAPTARPPRGVRYAAAPLDEAIGNDGLKITFNQSAATNWPAALTAWPSGLHPGIGGQNPERRDQRADRHHQRGEEMQPMPDAFEAEQHDAEKARLEEERGQNLVAISGPITGRPCRKRRPVGAELVGPSDARHHAHAEGDRKDF